MTEKQVEREVLMSLENAACFGRSPGDYSEYCKKLTQGVMIAISKYREAEAKKETTEEK